MLAAEPVVHRLVDGLVVLSSRKIAAATDHADGQHFVGEDRVRHLSLSKFGVLKRYGPSAANCRASSHNTRAASLTWAISIH